MTFIIAITNQKGGVGKTTTSVNLAVGLSLIENIKAADKEHPERILFIAIDGQGDGAQIMAGTFRQGGQESYDGPTIYNLLVDENPPNTQTVVKPAVIPIFDKFSKNIDYIPISPSLQPKLSDRLSTATAREYRLKEALESILPLYKYIIIDTPPNVGVVTMNALFAATHYLAPMIPNGAGLRYLSDLLATIEKTRKRYNPGLESLGILPSKCMIARSETRLALEQLELNFGKLLLSPIYERNDVQTAFSAGLDVFSCQSQRSVEEKLSSDFKGAQEDFGKLVQTVYDRLNADR